MDDKNTLKEIPSVCSLKLANTFVKLHDRAMKESKGNEGSFIIKNSAIEGEGKNAKFYGAGSHILGIIPKDNTVKEKIKAEEALTKLKTYMHWFIGPDIANAMTKEMLVPMENLDIKTVDADKELKKEKQKSEEAKSENSDNEETAEEKTEEKTEETAKESLKSIFSQSFKDYLVENYIIEADPSAEEDKDTKEETKDDNSANGYQVAYTLKIEGQSEKPLALAIKKFASDFLDDLTITTRSITGGAGHSTTVGKIKDTWEAVFRKMSPDKFKTEFDNSVHKKFPQGDLRSEIYDIPTISKYLKKQLTPKDKSKLTKAKYALCVKADKNDKSYKLYNTTVIADLVTSSIKGLFKMWKNQVKADDVILVNNYSDTKLDKKAAKYNTDKEVGTVDIDDSLEYSIGLMQHIFEDIVGLDELLIEKTGSSKERDNFEKNKELNLMIELKTLANIRKNEVKVQEKWGEKKNGLDKFNWPGKYKEQYDEFNKLIFGTEEDNLEEIKSYVNNAVHNKGDTAKLQKEVLTRFIAAIKPLSEDLIEDPSKDSESSNIEARLKELNVARTNADFYIVPMPGLSYDVRDANK